MSKSSGPPEARARTEPIRVVLGHPVALIRLGFAQLSQDIAGVRLCAVAATVEQTVTMTNRHRADVLVLATGFREAIARVRHLPRVLLLSPHAHTGATADAHSCAFASEQVELDSLADTLRHVVGCSESHVGRMACLRCPLRRSFEPAALPLSRREKQVFDLIASCEPTREIAARLGISIKTVETYRSNIKVKLGLRSSAALVEAAILWRHGIRLP